MTETGVQENNFIIEINPTKVAKVLALIAGLLAVISIASVSFRMFALNADCATGYRVAVERLVRLVDLRHEANIPTFFSTFLLLFAWLLLSVTTLLKRRQGDRYTRHWCVFAVGFMVMAADELAQFHDKAATLMRQLLGGGNLGIFNHAWIIPALFLVMALGIYFLPFMRHLPVKTRNRFITAAALFVGGAVGLEAVEGYIWGKWGDDTLLYELTVTVEESCEMFGVILFIWALFKYLQSSVKSIQFSVA